MRYTRNRQLRKINSVMESTWCLTIEDSMRYVWSDKLDKSFMWLRIHYEDDKKVRNYWGIAGTYARKIK